jgi:hypothetical protein
MPISCPSNVHLDHSMILARYGHNMGIIDTRRWHAAAIFCPTEKRASADLCRVVTTCTYVGIPLIYDLCFILDIGCAYVYMHIVSAHSTLTFSDFGMVVWYKFPNVGMVQAKKYGTPPKKRQKMTDSVGNHENDRRGSVCSRHLPLEARYLVASSRSRS